jgi:hypothetical protein
MIASIISLTYHIIYMSFYLLATGSALHVDVRFK